MLSLNAISVRRIVLSHRHHLCCSLSTASSSTPTTPVLPPPLQPEDPKNNPSTRPSAPLGPNHQQRLDVYADQDATWVDRHLPPFIKPYAKLARIDRPIGTMLLLWPCWWSIGMAAPAGTMPDLQLAALFGVGAFVMRGAGCTINDLWDRKYDAKVERTLNRPLASGQITPFQALVFLGGQLTCGLGVLLQLNPYSIALGSASLGLVIVYPLMKRYTHFPQLVLGLTFNWGALLGWAAVHGSCDWTVLLPLYGSGVMWTLMYDTLYAHQDKKDDSKLGLKSTALYFGNSKTALYGFAGTSTAALMASGYCLGTMGLPFYLGVLGAGCHMTWQIKTADFDSRMNLNDRFVSNNVVGGIVMGGILFGGCC
jgi:4-hydroxybenzoate polyprenyltransferase